MTNEDLLKQLEDIAEIARNGRPKDETNLDPELLDTLGYIFGKARLAVLKYREGIK